MSEKVSPDSIFAGAADDRPAGPRLVGPGTGLWDGPEPGEPADALVCLARDLRRLPGVFAALFGGQIDRAEMVVFAGELAAVSGRVAAAIVMAVIGAAASMTTGQLRAELRALVLMVEPGAVRRRAEPGRAGPGAGAGGDVAGEFRSLGIAGRELPAARAGPGNHAAAGRAWLASLRFQWLERGQCGHRREGQAYRPGRTLRHLIMIRQRTCGHPGGRRPAQDCDIDHTIPYQQGDRTCECNCAPWCKR